MTAPERGTAAIRPELARRVGPFAPRTLVPCGSRTLDTVARTLVAAADSSRCTSETDGRTRFSAGSSS